MGPQVLYQAVGHTWSSAVGQGTYETAASEYAEAQLGAAGDGLEVVMPNKNALGDLERYGPDP
jgi:hypothetical protein